MKLKINSIQISYYTENNGISELQYLADKLCEDDDIEYVELKSKKVANLNKIVVGNEGSIFTKLSKYSYEFQINDELKIIAVNGNEISQDDNEDNTVTQNFEYIEDGLTLWYDGINNNGTGTHNESSQSWKDLSGNNNDGVLENFDFSTGSGWSNNGLLFDGANDKVKFKGDITSNYTISVLVQPATTGNSSYPRLIGEIPFPTLSMRDNQSYMIGQNLDSMFSNASQISTNEKTMITITYDGSNIKLYENDKYISQLATTTKPESVIDAYLGGRKDNDRQYKGYIYNCMIYDKALTQGQISNNYKVNISRFGMQKNSIYVALSDDKEDTNSKLVNISYVGPDDDLVIEYQEGTNTGKWEKYNEPFLYKNIVYIQLKDKDGNILDSTQLEFKEPEIIIADDVAFVQLSNMISNNVKKYEVYFNDKLINNNVTEEQCKVDNLTSNTQYNVKLKVWFYSGSTIIINKKIMTLNNYGYIKDGLTLWYDGINNNGTGTHSENSQIWKDLSGNNNDGILEEFDFSTGSEWSNNGLLFDGVNDKVKFKGDITSNYTISLLVQPATTGNEYYPRFIGDIPFPTLSMNGNRSYMIGQSLDSAFSDANKISTDEKTMLTITYDGSNIKLYENDKYISQLAITTKPESVINAYLGGRKDNDRQYKGYIYNCMIFNRTLDQSAIATNYNANNRKYN